MHSLISLTISIKISYIFDKYFKFLDRKWPQVQKPMVRLFRDLLISAVRLKVESRPGPKWSKIVQESWTEAHIFALLDETTSWSADPSSFFIKNPRANIRLVMVIKMEGKE